MINCTHELVEWEQCDEAMHCLGSACRSCRYVELRECHHQTRCRVDFCGVDPVFEEVATARPEPVP